MGYGPKQVVAGQPRVNLPFGLFSVVNFRNAEDQHWANGIEWEAMTCDPASGFTDPNCEDLQEKFFHDMVERGEADSFVVYGSAKCGTPGGRADLKAEEAATAHLLAREEAQAEAFVWTALKNQGWSMPAQGEVAPLVALAALENWMGEVYGSLGVIHAERGVVSLWTHGGQVKQVGNKLTTILGTPVVAGAGYNGSDPSGNLPSPTTSYAWASPALFGYRGPVLSRQAVDMGDNTVYALAERQYVIGIDPCPTAFVQVNTSVNQ